MTGTSMRKIHERVGDAVSIFIPSSPTPFTGYTITVPREEVFELPISVEEAIRFAVSGGVLVPKHQDATDAVATAADHASTGLIPLPGSEPDETSARRGRPDHEDEQDRRDAG
jgi:uncharacterized membrane protein